MRMNDEVKSIASATGWSAEFNVEPRRRPLICWALMGNQLVGLVSDAKQTAARSVEDVGGFERYLWGQPPAE